MTWFKSNKGPRAAPREEDKTVRTEGLFTKCEGCRAIIWKKDLEANDRVCPKCGYHFKIGAYETLDTDLVSPDPLKFVDRQPYSEKLAAAQRATGLNDAVVNARGKLGGRTTLISAMEYSFIGGSMGSVVGEMMTLAIERALDGKTPL